MTILKFPEIRQFSDYDCGAVAAQAILIYFGIDISEDKIIRITGTTKKAGAPISGIKSVARAFGLKSKAGPMTVDQVKKYLDKKIPVILLLQAWSDKKVDYTNTDKFSHYAVAIGYDKNKFYFEDPWIAQKCTLTFRELGDRWHWLHQGKKFDNYGIVFYGKKPRFGTQKHRKMG